ncbi:VWA domain-containing protein [Streptomyces sp. NPDC048420]|uniref:vWA domain-containing protein n=1 Tax=Streptomyces sp. NPDC048420 TaxID=3155755 RepID=UPI00342FABA2
MKPTVRGRPLALPFRDRAATKSPATDKPAGRGPRGLARAAVAVLALLAAASLGVPAATADTTPTRADVYTALGLDDQPADYAVLVDTSGSMTDEGRYDTVRTALGLFLDGLSSEDHVALFTFDSTPEPRYIGAAGDTDRILSTLPDTPDENGATDIGSALDSALGELERSDAVEVASVVLLTDGAHSPPDGSPYPDSTGPAWNALHERARALGERGTELAGYALPLEDGATGADLLGDVIDDATVLRPDSVEDLGGYLERAGDGTRLRKAGLVLAGDVGKGISATWTDRRRRDLTAGDATAEITLTSTTRHVPLTVRGLHVSVSGEPVRISGLPATLTLDPGQTRTFPVRLRGTLSDGPVPYLRDRDTDVPLRVSGRVSSAWEQALAPDVRLKVPREVRTTGAALPLHATVGSAVLLPGLIGAVVAVLLIRWLTWRRTHRPRLRGELLLTPVYGGQLPDRIPLRGRRVQLRPQAIGGRGSVHGRRRSTEGGPRVDLLIRYTPDGTSRRQSDATCGPGGQVVVNGVSFTYLTQEPADRVPAGGRSR